MNYELETLEKLVAQTVVGSGGFEEETSVLFKEEAWLDIPLFFPRRIINR